MNLSMHQIQSDMIMHENIYEKIYKKKIVFLKFIDFNNFCN